MLQWKSNKYYIFLLCVCSLRYPACNAHAPYWHLRPVRFYNTFPHYLVHGTIKKKVILYKCVFWFSLQLLSEYLILRRTVRDIIKMYIGLHIKYRFCCHILMKLQFSHPTLEKLLIEFQENPFRGSRVVPCGRTERHQTWRS